MSLLFPIQFRRQYAAPLDEDLVFSSIAEMNTYLTSGRRYSGQIVTCLETEGVAYILSNDKASWIMVNMPEAGSKDYLIVETIFERNSIPDQLRKIGLLVYVVETGTEYRLINGIDNIYWVEKSDSGNWEELNW